MTNSNIAIYFVDVQIKWLTYIFFFPYLLFVLLLPIHIGSIFETILCNIYYFLLFPSSFSHCSDRTGIVEPTLSQIPSFLMPS